MPSASIISPLRCWNCGKLLVKEDELKCSWCGKTYPVEVGEEKTFCKRSHPRFNGPKGPLAKRDKAGGTWVLLAKRDKAICPRCGEETLMIREKKTMSKKFLTKLFNEQIRTLKDGGCPELLIQFFLLPQREEVISKAREMNFGEGNIPFLPVIPQIYSSFYDQMSRVRSCKRSKKIGLTLIRPEDIVQEIETPPRPYYIFDVESGSKTPDCCSSEEIEKYIKAKGRSPLTAVEIIALAVHTNILLRHNLRAAGTKYSKDPGDVVSISLDDLRNNRPILTTIPSYLRIWASPSCSCRCCFIAPAAPVRRHIFCSGLQFE